MFNVRALQPYTYVVLYLDPQPLLSKEIVLNIVQIFDYNYQYKKTTSLIDTSKMPSKYQICLVNIKYV